MTKIKFGTDGWRAAIAEDYTFHNVRRCARGVAEYLQQTGAADRGVVVCHDRRFASEHFARACVEVLAAHDIRSFTPPDYVPTQVGSFFTRELGAGAGIVITASHNPWTDNGFKVKADTRRRRGAGDARRDRVDHGYPPGGRAAAAARVRRRRGRRPGRDVRPVPALPRPAAEHRRHRADPRRRQAGAGRGPVRLRVRLVHAPARRRAPDGARAPHGAQSVLRRREPRADPPQRRRVAGGDPGLAGRHRDRLRRRRRPRRDGHRGGRLRQPAAGVRAAVLVSARRARPDRPGGVHRDDDVDGEAPGRDLRHAGPRDRRRLQVRRVRR